MDNDEKFPKRFRLRSQSEFDAVYGNDVFAADQVLVIQASANGRSYSRLGLSVGRKVGNAVCRNRWKRVIREAFRLQRAQLPAGIDLVVRPRRGAICESQAVARSLERLVNRLARKLLPQQGPSVRPGRGRLS